METATTVKLDWKMCEVYLMVCLLIHICLSNHRFNRRFIVNHHLCKVPWLRVQTACPVSDKCGTDRWIAVDNRHFLTTVPTHCKTEIVRWIAIRTRATDLTMILTDIATNGKNRLETEMSRTLVQEPRTAAAMQQTCTAQDLLTTNT